jgi:hypothetical protein
METIEHEKEEGDRLIKLYPWLFTHWEYDEKKKKGKYAIMADPTMSEYFSLPEGWRKRFGEDMLKDLNRLLSLDPEWAKEYHIDQAKEKYGSMCWYDSGCPESLRIQYDRIMGKYESLSEITCVKCGKDATRMTRGWIVPVCDACAGKEIANTDEITADDRKKILDGGWSSWWDPDGKQKKGAVSDEVLVSDAKEFGLIGAKRSLDGQAFFKKLIDSAKSVSYETIYREKKLRTEFKSRGQWPETNDAQIVREASSLIIDAVKDGGLLVKEEPNDVVILTHLRSYQRGCSRISLITIEK